MGIRINKILGWGLRYTKGYNDPRLNTKLYDDVDLTITKEQILNYIDSNDRIWNNRSKFFEHELTRDNYDVYDFVHFESTEGDVLHPFLILSLRGTEHYRYDDVIDYYDSDPQSTKVKMIVDDANQVSGIYPYFSFVNKKTGQPIPKVYPSQRWSITNCLLMVLKEHPEKIDDINEIISKEYGEFGIYTLIDWQRNIGVEISPVLNALIELSGIFKDPTLKYRLKPMLVSFWR